MILLSFKSLLLCHGISSLFSKRSECLILFTFYSTGKKYGVKPKFLRMQEFHMLLFYLCRAYNGELVQVNTHLKLVSFYFIVIFFYRVLFQWVINIFHTFESFLYSAHIGLTACPGLTFRTTMRSSTFRERGAFSWQRRWKPSWEAWPSIKRN